MNGNEYIKFLFCTFNVIHTFLLHHKTIYGSIKNNGIVSINLW